MPCATAARRFGVGMEMKSGPMRYRSRQPPVRLSEDEEAALAFAACGVTGYALGELMYERARARRSSPACSSADREPSSEAIDATVAFCDYVYRRHGRFPAYPPPFRTVLGYQANHVDVEFYDRFYKPEALSETQRRHMERWHAQPSNDDN